jgi:uncharacterized protein involved in exopolysaccharide biosynthesis
MPEQERSISEGARFIKFLYRWRKLLWLVLAASVVATIIATLFMPAEFESTGIIFPTPTNSPEKILTEPQFGYEVDADWLMQVLKSDIVKDTLVKSFSLIDYYRLDTSKLDWRDVLNKKYIKTIQFERTRYMSIEITARTRNPELSSAIVNTVIDKIDGIRERIFKENTERTVKYYEKSLFDKFDLINEMVDSLYDIRSDNITVSQEKLYRQIKQKQADLEQAREKLNAIRNEYNFYDIGQYVEILNDNLAESKALYALESGKVEILKQSLNHQDTALLNAQARMEGARLNILQFEEELASLSPVRKQYTEINDQLMADLNQLNQLREQYENTLNAFEPYVNSIRLERLVSDYTHEQVLLNEIRYKYEMALLNYHTPIPSVYVINRATPSYERVSPSWIKNGLIIILSTLIFTVGMLLFYERFQDLETILHEREL